MDTVLLILQVIMLLGIGVVALLVRKHLSSYLTEKGKNLATKEDVGEITRKIEEVRADYAKDLERLKVELGVETRRKEIMVEEKMNVFRAFQQRLLGIKRYCDAAAAEFTGNEFQPRVSDLQGRQSALIHLTELASAMEEHRLLLAPLTRAALIEFMRRASLLCSMELAMVANKDDPEITGGAKEAYDAASDEADKCLEILHQDLRG